MSATMHLFVSMPSYICTFGMKKRIVQQKEKRGKQIKFTKNEYVLDIYSVYGIVHTAMSGQLIYCMY